jgi:hypothetical protein
MEVLIAFPIVIVLFTVGAILKGWVLSILWGWFIVPVFHLPQLSVVAAIGVAMALSYTVNGLTSGKGNKDKDGVARILTMLLGPFVVLFVGWIVHLFM